MLFKHLPLNKMLNSFETCQYHKALVCLLLFSEDSQCDAFTCANGGTCIDIEHTFSCLCPPGWEGITCHLRKHLIKASNFSLSFVAA